MKWIGTLILTAALTLTGYSKERLRFPFDQTTRVTFIRLGNMELDAGQQFVLEVDQGQWRIKRRISRAHATVEDITEERAQEILKAFAELYSYWQNTPYRDPDENAYSLYVSTTDTWQMALRVKDRGSPQLTQLIELIEYPEGLVLNDVKEDNTPGDGIRASTTDDPLAAEGDSDSSGQP